MVKTTEFTVKGVKEGIILEEEFAKYTLTPQAAHSLITQLQRALFEYHEKTGEKIDKPKCF
jgi:hypothetical protein